MQLSLSLLVTQEEKEFLLETHKAVANWQIFHAAANKYQGEAGNKTPHNLLVSGKKKNFMMKKGNWSSGYTIREEISQFDKKCQMERVGRWL